MPYNFWIFEELITYRNFCTPPPTGTKWILKRAWIQNTSDIGNDVGTSETL